jgi:hypothetical protein
MKKALFTILMVAVAWFAGQAVASAQVSTTQNLTVNATVSARVTLILAGGPVNFPDADPDTTPSIVSGNVVTVTARARIGTAGTVTLTCQAGGPLTSGTDTIAISNVTWAGAGAGFDATGTMSSAAGQPVGSWTGPGSRSGTQTYSLANSWSYVPGGYSATVTYTLSAV